MTNTVQDPIKADWKAVQDKSSERASRIREIVTGAASEVVTELKDVTVDLQHLSRKSLADMIAQLRAREAADADASNPIPVDDATVALVEVEAPVAESTVPSWRQLINDLVSLLNTRKGVWTHHLLLQLDRQMAKYDADMTAEYGDRYARTSRIVNRLRSWVQWAAARAQGPVDPKTDATPVAIEVLDDDSSSVTTTAQ